MKSKRKRDTKISDALKRIQSEVTSKLQYLSASVLELIRTIVESLCADTGSQESVLVL